MLNSRQRAQLRALANTMDPSVQIGKGGLGETVLREMDEALEARELIKIKGLETTPIGVREAADTAASALGADVVQVIGRVFILYRPSKEKVPPEKRIRLVR